MSLGDELRQLRAMAGGPTPNEIEEATGSRILPPFCLLTVY